jgi:ribosomal-protein-alanine N-acetyltransferase
MKRDESGVVIGFDEFPVLETERLQLRRMTMDDAGFYLKHFSDPGIVSMSAFEAPKDMAAAIAELREYCVDIFTNDAGIRWGITLRNDPNLIGTLGFYKWVKNARHAEIGYDLDGTYRRQGIMTEALTAALDYIFNKVELNRVQALTDPTNTPSVRLLDKLGFRQEGVLRDYTYFRGKYLNDLLFSLLRREWDKRRS